MYTKVIRIQFMLILCFVLSTMYGQKNGTTRIIDMKDYYNPSSPTAGFQEAVDFLKPGGGIIHVSPGTYKIRKAIVLYSGIYVTGCGEHSVIERIDTCIQKPLLADAKQGEYEITVKDAAGFVKGGDVVIASEPYTDWECTTGTIIDIRGQTIRIDRPLEHNYILNERASVMNFFPAFTAEEGNDIQIENIVIDGHMKQNSNYYNLFVCSAIHFLRVTKVDVNKVTVRNYPSDGISMQAGSNVSVTRCLVEYCLGNGFHPGSDLQVSTWSHNVGRFNGWDGLFFCFNIRYSTFSDNKFHNNKRNGIGDIGQGGATGDQMNVISGNYCFNNYLSGIECSAGGHNTVVNNVCENNSRSEPGRWHDIYLKNTHATLVQGNRCSNSPESGPGNIQGHGIFLRDGCTHNIVTGNILSGYAVGISGNNLDKNTIEHNISIEEPATNPGRRLNR